jgi:succinate dehydrogenase hydrophobic anchor subunit
LIVRLDILNPILYSRTVIDQLLWPEAKAEALVRVIIKHPPPISLIDTWGKTRMKVPEESQGIGASVLPILEKLPILSRYARTSGWHYVISWLHRLTGIGLVIILTLHLYARSSVQTSAGSNAAMNVLASPIFLFLVWASSLAVSFHALNGGRLILYELFGRRSDAATIRWIFGLSTAYAAIVGLLMILKNQSVSALFFWLITFCIGAVTAYAVECRMSHLRHSLFWKLQRISGAFLFTSVPAYLFFLYLNPVLADVTRTGIALMQDIFIRVVTLALVVSALYHAGYGLFSIAADYTSSRIVRVAMTALIIAIIIVLGALAFSFIFSL